MKGPSCAFVASVVAASTAALSSAPASGDPNAAFDPNHGYASHPKVQNMTTHNSSDKDKFAPRFDGLRFIETLVTAHR